MSWRHLKDERKKDELVEGKGGNEMTESAFNPSGKYVENPFSGPPTSQGPPGYGGGPPNFGGSGSGHGSARQWASDGNGFGGSVGGSQQFTSQEI